MNTSEKLCKKKKEYKSEKEELSKEVMEDEESLSKDKDVFEKSCPMWKGVLDTIDKNMAW